MEQVARPYGQPAGVGKNGLEKIGKARTGKAF
jgi:hypothetical protein